MFLFFIFKNHHVYDKPNPRLKWIYFPRSPPPHTHTQRPVTRSFGVSLMCVWTNVRATVEMPVISVAMALIVTSHCNETHLIHTSILCIKLCGDFNTSCAFGLNMRYTYLTYFVSRAYNKMWPSNDRTWSNLYQTNVFKYVSILDFSTVSCKGDQWMNLAGTPSGLFFGL